MNHSTQEALERYQERQRRDRSGWPLRINDRREDRTEFREKPNEQG